MRRVLLFQLGNRKEAMDHMEKKNKNKKKHVGGTFSSCVTEIKYSDQKLIFHHRYARRVWRRPYVGGYILRQNNQSSVTQGV